MRVAPTNDDVFVVNIGIGFGSWFSNIGIVIKFYKMLIVSVSLVLSSNLQTLYLYWFLAVTCYY